MGWEPNSVSKAGSNHMCCGVQVNMYANIYANICTLETDHDQILTIYGLALDRADLSAQVCPASLEIGRKGGGEFPGDLSLGSLT